MPRRDPAQTVRWHRVKVLTAELARAQVVDTPESRAWADRLKRDIAAVYRAAGFPYPVVPPVDRDDHADATAALLATLQAELRRTLHALTEMAAWAIRRASITRAASREAVRQARAMRGDKKH
jgi:hypothetical protein